MGTIRDEDDAHLVAVELNNILENIRNDLDYGHIYTDYSPDGTYSVTGSASSWPIFSGAYTKPIKQRIKLFIWHCLNLKRLTRITIKSKV